MTPDHDPQTGLSNALDDEPATTTGPLPAWLAEQLDLEQRRQQAALPLIEANLRNLLDGTITLDGFAARVNRAVDYANAKARL